MVAQYWSWKKITKNVQFKRNELPQENTFECVLNLFDREMVSKYKSIKTREYKEQCQSDPKPYYKQTWLIHPNYMSDFKTGVVLPIAL